MEAESFYLASHVRKVLGSSKKRNKLVTKLNRNEPYVEVRFAAVVMIGT
jgi:hypothetical protein